MMGISSKHRTAPMCCVYYLHTPNQTPAQYKIISPFSFSMNNHVLDQESSHQAKQIKTAYNG